MKRKEYTIDLGNDFSLTVTPYVVWFQHKDRAINKMFSSVTRSELAIALKQVRHGRLKKS